MSFNYYCAGCHRLAVVPVAGVIAGCMCGSGPWIEVSPRVTPGQLGSVVLQSPPPLLTPQMKASPPPITPGPVPGSTPLTGQMLVDQRATLTPPPPVPPPMPKPSDGGGGGVTPEMLAQGRTGLHKPTQVSHRDGMGRWVGQKSEDAKEDYRGLKFVPGLKTRHRQGRLQGHTMVVPKELMEKLNALDRGLLTLDRHRPGANKMWTRVIAQHMLTTGRCVVSYRVPGTATTLTYDLTPLFRRVAEGRAMAGVNWKSVTDKFHDGHETTFNYLPPLPIGYRHVIYYVEPLKKQGGAPGALRVVLAPPDWVFFTYHYAPDSWQVFSWDHGAWYTGHQRPYVSPTATELQLQS
jgi:hypothetical protein